MGLDLGNRGTQAESLRNRLARFRDDVLFGPSLAAVSTGLIGLPMVITWDRIPLTDPMGNGD
jgi:hypothetical protein